MVGHLARADRAEVDRVVGLELLERVVGDHLAGLGVVVRAPREVGELERERALGVRGDALEHADALGEHLAADPVGGDGRDAVDGWWSALDGSWP